MTTLLFIQASPGGTESESALLAQMPDPVGDLARAKQEAGRLALLHGRAQQCMAATC